MLKTLKAFILRKLLEDVDLEEIKVRRIRIGDRTMILTPDYVDFAALTADPTLAAGRMWFNEAEGVMKYSPDGVEKKVFPIAMGTEYYYSTTLAAGASYTPADEGAYTCYGRNFRSDEIATEIYDGIDAVWRWLWGTPASAAHGLAQCFLSDGANVRIRNAMTVSRDIALIRGYGFAVEYVNIELAAKAYLYPPSNIAFYFWHPYPARAAATGTMHMYVEVIGAWAIGPISEPYSDVAEELRCYPYGLYISDGANIRIYNSTTVAYTQILLYWRLGG